MNLGDSNARTYFYTKHGISLGRRSNRIWSMRMWRKGHMSNNYIELLEDTLSKCCEARITEAGEFCTACWEHC